MLTGIQISDTKQAMALTLEKIHNLVVLGKDPDLKNEDDDITNQYHILNSFDLDGKYYKIHRSVFSEVINSIASKGLIEIKILEDLDVAGYFHDPMIAYEYIADLVREDPNVNVRELMKECLVFFEVPDLKKLEKEIERFESFETKPIKKVAPPTFNEKTSILSFRGEEILISKSQNTHPHYLLITLFKDLKKNWSLDEIEEDWGTLRKKTEKINWSRYYNAARNINEKIAMQTKINDFLKYTSKEMRINADYI